MGLLGKLFGGGGTAAAVAGWQPDGTGVVSNGDCGGDIQRGESYSVRFVHPDLYGSLVTITYYAVEYDECPGEFAVQPLATRRGTSRAGAEEINWDGEPFETED